jgi:hypothetical protein
LRYNSEASSQDWLQTHYQAPAGLALGRDLTQSKPRRKRGNLLGDEQVQIDFVLLADYATAVQNKLTVVGAGWNLFHASEYPTVIPFGLGIGLLVPWSQTNRRHSFRFEIRKSEGSVVATGGGDVEMGRQPGIPLGMTQRIVLGVAGQVRAEEPGTYEIIVTTEHDEKVVSFEAMSPRRRE